MILDLGFLAASAAFLTWTVPHIAMPRMGLQISQRGGGLIDLGC